LLASCLAESGRVLTRWNYLLSYLEIALGEGLALLWCSKEMAVGGMLEDAEL
jgi:hypothetical protein